MARALLRSALALALCGCGAGVRAGGPEPAIQRYAVALEQTDAPSAWAILDEDARRGHTREEHAALMEANRAELVEQGRALARAAESGAAVAHARVTLRTGETVVLVLEDGQWRIDGGVLAAAGLATPLDAVAAFRRALMRHDLPGVERVLSRQTRAAALATPSHAVMYSRRRPMISMAEMLASSVVGRSPPAVAIA